MILEVNLNIKAVKTRKQLRKFLYLLLLFIMSSHWGHSQQQYLMLHPLDKDTIFLKEKLTYNRQLPDTLSVQSTIKQILLDLQGQSYLEASVDSLVIKDSLHHAYLHIGASYQWMQLSNGNIEDAFLSQIGFRERLYQNKPFYYENVRKVQEDLLSYAEDNGYPFAQVRLDSVQVNNGKISAQLKMEKGTLIFVDSLKIEGEVVISKTYLESYLGLKSGTPFSKTKLLKIRDRIRELAFLKEKRPSTVTFEGNQAVINLFLERKKASKFDFIVGFLPANNNDPTQPAQRLLFTGSFEGEMQNQFGVGERIYAKLERLMPETQSLELEFSYPYLLDLPFGVETTFGLYRRSTAYRDQEYDLGIQYLLEGGNYVKAFIDNASSALIEIDTSRLLSTRQLPNQLDYTNASFGIEYLMQRLDYRFNPRQGWSAKIRASAGVKRIKENLTILEFSDNETDFGMLYDSLNLRSFQYRLSTSLATYIPLFQRTTLKIGNRSGFIFAEEPILFNEQFRVGGNRLLRGFDEESIQADWYSVMTLEYRLLIGQNSYFYGFGDLAYIRDELRTENIEDFPYGFGAGLTFETKVGLFGISLAWGTQQNNPINFGTPKIHFGYVSLF